MSHIPCIERRLRVQTAKTVVVRRREHAAGTCEKIGMIEAFKLWVPAHLAQTRGTANEEIRNFVTDDPAFEHTTKRQDRASNRPVNG